MRHLRYGVAANLVFLGSAAAAAAQQGQMDLTVEAPRSIAALADRVREIDQHSLAARLGQAGLDVPPQVLLELIPDDDPRSRATPRWVVGTAFGPRNVAVFPGRVGPYPYQSLESVVSHEVVHLALTVQAGGPLPRWFHEGVATSVEQGWGLSSQARLVLATATNPALVDLERLFQSASAQENRTAYLLATALVSDIRARHGAASPGAIVDRVALGMTFQRAFLLETGERPDEAAARAWAPYRQWTNWIPVLASGSMLWTGILTLACVALLARLRKRARLRRQWDAWDDHDEPVSDRQARA